MAEESARTIRIVVKGQGLEELKKIAGGLDNLTKQTRSLSSVGSKLNAALNFGFLGIGITQITAAADSINLLRDRIDQLSGGSEAGERNFQRLASSAQKTKTSIESLSTIYARLAVTTKDLGVNQDQLFRVTEALQNSFRLSGATTAEATSAAIQLSQGFASGQLRGQELRSVLEANVVVGELLAKTFKVTRGELFKLAEEGRLGADKVFKALLESSEDLQQQADQLSITFGQVFTQAIDRVNVSLAELSKNVDAPGKLQKGLTFLLDQFSEIALVAGGALAFFFKGTLIAAFKAATTAVLTFSAAIASAFLATPVGAAIAALVVAGAALFAVFADLGSIVDSVKRTFVDFALFVLPTIDKINQFIVGKLFGEEARKDAKAYFQEVKDGLQQTQAALSEDLRDRLAFERAGQTDLNRRDLSQATKAIKDTRTELQKLNELFNQGKIDLEEYAQRLNVVQFNAAKLDFDKGKKSIFQFREEARQFKELDINKEFEQGAISLDRFNKEILALRGEELRDKFLQGKIGAVELRVELEKIEKKLAPGNFFEQGVNNYLDTIKTLSEELAGVVTNSFKNLEDAIFQTTKNGKFAFKDFAQSVLDDLTKVFIRTQVVANLAQGLNSFGAALAASFATPGPGASSISPTGTSGAIAFADGGILSKATPFSFANKLGVAGEAGPEAIMPLRRMSNGEMGVAAAGGGSNVTVNVINNSGNEIQQRESVDSSGQKVIDIIVLSKVKEGFAKGLFDKELNNSFGIKRRGV